MEMALSRKSYNREGYEDYILGSAEVVGLICLRVFCEGNKERLNALQPFTMRLGSAYQKINFLRDMRADYMDMGRIYFPGIDFNTFNPEAKKPIEKKIESDFHMGCEGIKKRPGTAFLGDSFCYSSTFLIKL